MGQQQLLLIILGIIIIGVALATSIIVFRQQAIDNKKDLVARDCISLATLAIDYYNKPLALGGGGKSFIGWYIPPSMVTTSSGTFSAEIQADEIKLTGLGNEVVTDDDLIKVEVMVYPKSFKVNFTN